MNFYKNGNYFVGIAEDGTKIRQTQDDYFKPKFAENCDVKITDKCGVGCPFCYEGCTQNGKHADLLSFKFIHDLHPFTEMALNGNDMDHPQLNEFLQLLNSQNVYANMTVHQSQFMNNYDKIKELTDNGLIHGLGISYHHYDEEFIQRMKEFPNAVLHTIYGILSEDDVKNLDRHDIKLLILGYKDLGRGIAYHRDYRGGGRSKIIENQFWLYGNIQSIISGGYFKVVSFDNLAIEQLDIERILSKDEWDKFYMGDDGQFTFYIDMVKGEFAKNSISQKRYPIDDMSIDDMFRMIRKETI